MPRVCMMNKFWPCPRSWAADTIPSVVITATRRSGARLIHRRARFSTTSTYDKRGKLARVRGSSRPAASGPTSTSVSPASLVFLRWRLVQAHLQVERRKLVTNTKRLKGSTSANRERGKVKLSSSKEARQALEQCSFQRCWRDRSLGGI